MVDEHIATAQVDARWYGSAPDTFSVQWFGYLVVVRPGRYTFALTSDDASVLSIDGRRVVDNSGRHAEATQTASVTLTRGAHPVLIEFTQYTGAYAIDWQWAHEAGALESVAAAALTPYKPSFWRVVLGRGFDGAVAFLLAAALMAIVLIVIRDPRLFVRHPRWATLALFALLAVVHTWPLATNPGHLARHDNRDSMLNEWIIAWVAHQAPRNPLRLFDGNIFYPERHTLAFSEPMLPQAAMAAPVRLFGGSPVLASGLLLLAGFTLTGWSMCLVVRRWTGDWTAAIVSGAIFAFNAHTLTRIPHLQAQHVEFLPPAILALDALLAQPGVRRGIQLAAWSVLQATTSVHLLAMTFFAIAVAVVSRPADWLGQKFAPFIRSFGIATALAAGALVPLLLPYYYASQEQGVTRSLADATLYAATWQDYLSTASRLWYPLWSHRFFMGTALFPGALGLLLTAVALIRGDAFRDRRARMCLAIGIAGIVLSFGPRLPGYGVLQTIVPVLQGIRGTARFGYLATFAASALAGFGLIALRRSLPRRLWPAVGTAVVIAASLESIVSPLGLSRFTAIAPIYFHLPDTPDTRVVEMPFWGPRSAQFHASYMLNSTAHWRPIVNGYSGFQPRSFYEHARTLQAFPDDESIALLRRLGITHIFIHTTQMAPEAVTEVNARPELRIVERFGSIELYELKSVTNSELRIQNSEPKISQ